MSRNEVILQRTMILIPVVVAVVAMCLARNPPAAIQTAEPTASSGTAHTATAAVGALPANKIEKKPGPEANKPIPSAEKQKPSAAKPLSAQGSVTTQKTWDTGDYPLGGDSYIVGIQLQASPTPKVIIDYRGSKLTITRTGDQFQIAPYSNTPATCTVQTFRVTSTDVQIVLQLNGTTRNPSVVFAGGYKSSFEGDLTISGQWSDVGLKVAVVDKHRWSEYGNAQWDGTGVLSR